MSFREELSLINFIMIFLLKKDESLCSENHYDDQYTPMVGNHYNTHYLQGKCFNMEYTYALDIQESPLI